MWETEQSPLTWSESRARAPGHRRNKSTPLLGGATQHEANVMSVCPQPAAYQAAGDSFAYLPTVNPAKPGAVLAFQLPPREVSLNWHLGGGNEGTFSCRSNVDSAANDSEAGAQYHRHEVTLPRDALCGSWIIQKAIFEWGEQEISTQKNALVHVDRLPGEMGRRFYLRGRVFNMNVVHVELESFQGGNVIERHPDFFSNIVPPPTVAELDSLTMSVVANCTEVLYNDCNDTITFSDSNVGLQCRRSRQGPEAISSPFPASEAAIKLREIALHYMNFYPKWGNDFGAQFRWRK